MTSLDRSGDNDLLVALRHPLRRRILRVMRKRGVVSPVELATEFDKSLSHISYHVHVLLDCAAVTLVTTVPRGGSKRHLYCSTIRAPWALAIIEREGPGIDSAGESPGP